ncbi:ribose-phosphate diphosphokinase [Pseudoalteromonas sp. A757]|uniref:ribose-phosphate diphosphokinase n=1 Tax=Pseudoalteromonas sp. A757 TaxID=2250709 RepID=UPI000FFF517D|nr:ribose-phosphate diphosphokinase [Pseudoalteromonas sp. A757]RXE86279.1 ribose-phosphate pyrophosphokinase [Pseudoalteromonas sp. A757]
MKVTSYEFSGNKKDVQYEAFTFSGGEEHIRFKAFDFCDCEKVQITARVTNSSHIMRLLMAVDALKRLCLARTPIELVLPYFPYARQDRVCVTGEALGAKVMASLINQLALDKVTVWDAHSDVVPALLERVENVEQTTLISQCPALQRQLQCGALSLVSPDAGASKKTLKIAQHFGGEVEVIQAQKVRNLKTGEIVQTQVLGEVKGKDLLIVDDICDGGRTFTELAKVLKAQGANSIALYVTHGIFSQGLGVFSGLIDTVYTTNSCRDNGDLVEHHDVQFNMIEL